jgi:hypothetical protein
MISIIKTVIKVIAICVRSAGLVTILCRTRKIKARTHVKVKGNKFFNRTSNIIRVTYFISLELSVCFYLFIFRGTGT